MHFQSLLDFCLLVLLLLVDELLLLLLHKLSDPLFLQNGPTRHALMDPVLSPLLLLSCGQLLSAVIDHEDRPFEILAPDVLLLIVFFLVLSLH